VDAVRTPEFGEVPHWNESRARNRGTRRFASIKETAIGSCILVVDDDESIRETLADILEVVGYRAIQASDAAEALMILRMEIPVDALVTDLTMPGADGITLIRRAREIRHDLPAILLTGYAEEITSMTTIAGGNFHVLRKPVESDCLIEQLELLIIKAPEA
jgi:DNA-binding NtrC family response regulator